MKPEEYLQEVAKEFFKVSQAEKAAKDAKEGLRGEFFRLANEGYKGKDHLLPVKTVEVPYEFFEATGMSKEEFVHSRFPGWIVEHVEKNVSQSTEVFVLKRDPEFLGATVEVELDDYTIRVSKDIAEFTPEVDWGTLQAERPDLFEKLAREVTAYEVNDEELERLTIEAPEELATLERHLKVREPTKRATARKVKDERTKLR